MYSLSMKHRKAFIALLKGSDSPAQTSLALYVQRLARPEVDI